jgi:hypothetical protein
LEKAFDKNNQARQKLYERAMSMSEEIKEIIEKLEKK